MRSLPLVVALAAFAGTAHAQDDHGPYVGVSLGYFDYQESDDDFGAFIDDSTSAYRLLVGYQLNENLMIEGGFGRTNSFGESYPLFPPGSGTFDIEAEYEIATVRALGLVPVGQFDVFGGIGYYDATVTGSARATGVGLLGEIEDDEDGATLLGGVQFYLDNFTIRGEYEWFDSSSNVDAWDLNVSILFRFGR